MRSKLKKIFPFVYFSFLSFLILGPLLKSGYIFLLDFVLAPNFHLDFFSYLSGGRLLTSMPYGLFFWLLVNFFSVVIAQKVLLFLIFLFTGLITYCVLPKIFGMITRLLVGTFYLFNPFVYERFMAGHIFILLGYAFLPLTISFVLKFFKGGDKKDLLYLLFFWTLQTVFSSHFFVINGICFVLISIVYILVEYINNRQESVKNLFFKIKFFFYFFIKVAFLILLVNSWWILPPFFQTDNIVNNIDQQHFSSYISSPDKNFGSLVNLLGMYGFWREQTAGDEILLSKDFLPIWPLFFSIFLIPILAGIRYLWKKKNYFYLFSLLSIAAFAVLFSYGPRDNLIGSFNIFLFSYIPGLKGLRESQKFISVLVLVYAILMAYGLNFLKNLKRKLLYCLIVLLLFSNIFIFNFQFLWGAQGQVKAVEYPESFVRAKEFFANDKSDYNILIMPWHMYLIGHPLAQGRTIADPAPGYFYSYNILHSKDPEVGYLSNKKDYFSDKIIFLMGNNNKDLWNRYLKDLNIKYIFITKVDDIGKHGFDYKFLLNGEFNVLFEDDVAILLTLD